MAGKIRDERLRADVSNWLTYRATLLLLKRGELTRARALAARNEDLAQLAVCLVVGAQKLNAANDQPAVGEWLREASALMKKAPPDENWTKIALGIVAAYGQFDTAAALQSLGDAVRIMNRFPAEANRLERAPSVQRFTDITASDLTDDTRGFSLSAAVSGFRARDFEFVYGALRSVEKPEAWGEAVIVLCRQFLRPAPPRREAGAARAPASPGSHAPHRRKF